VNDFLFIMITPGVVSDTAVFVVLMLSGLPVCRVKRACCEVICFNQIAESLAGQ